MAKTKRRNDKIYRLSKKRKSVSKEGGYKDENEWEEDNYTPGRIIRFVLGVTGWIVISSAAMSYSMRHHFIG